VENVWLARPEAPPPGIRLAVKDLLDTAGLTTTYGSAIFIDHVPTRTAEAVLRLEAAGYANVGKTNLHEFAYGITSENPHFGSVPNPLAPGRSPGGSSGGNAAALVLGECDVALGTDSGGSIRIPAACCGIVGFKPTYDLVPLEGCFPLAPSFDHGGPMARTVAECAAAFAALVPGFVPRTAELEELRVGVAWLDEAEPLVRERVNEAAARFPHRRGAELTIPSGISALFMREVADVHRDLYAEHSDLYGENVAVKIDRCLEVTDAEVEHAVEARRLLRLTALEALDGLDLLLTPTCPCVAPPLTGSDLDSRPQMTRFTLPVNMLGWPALAVPCGVAEDGLPASVQLLGRPGDDALVLAAGAALEDRLSPIRGRARGT
jgi:aspartyl-tRNA(Asn)/glutamyl-tRNA(Gln) amidotransferase subunit A